jgi:hypothetical protein
MPGGPNIRFLSEKAGKMTEEKLKIQKEKLHALLKSTEDPHLVTYFKEMKGI